MPMFFLRMSYSFFFDNNSTSFESAFCIKTAKIRLFKEYLKRRNLQAWGFVCLLVGYISMKKKITENCNSVGAGAHKVGKVVSFWPNFDLIFLIFGEIEKGKLYILKKVGLNTVKEIL